MELKEVSKDIYNISAELEKEFGAPGTTERAKFDEEAYPFYTGQILLDARKEAKVTQSELAKRINATKLYISRIEKCFNQSGRRHILSDNECAGVES